MVDDITRPGQRSPDYQRHSDLSVSEEGSKLTPHWDSYPRMNSGGSLSLVSCRNWEPVGLPWDTSLDSKLGWMARNHFQTLHAAGRFQRVFNCYNKHSGMPMTSFVVQQVFANSLPAAKAAGHRSRWGKNWALAQFWSVLYKLVQTSAEHQQCGCPRILKGQHRILDGRIHSLRRWCVIPT